MRNQIVLLATLVALSLVQAQRPLPTFTIAGPSGSNRFGHSMAVGADSLLISAPDSGANGALHVADTSAVGPWTAPEDTAHATGTARGGGSPGYVGTDGTNEAYSSDIEEVYYNANTIVAPSGSDEAFGAAIALSADGNWLAIGAPNSTVPATEGAGGRAFVYDVSGGTPTLSLTLESVTVNETGFGAAVGWDSDNTLFVGATGGFGHVWLYDIEDATPTVADNQFQVFDQIPEGFGNKIAIGGDVAAVSCSLTRRVTSLARSGVGAANWTLAVESISTGLSSPAEALFVDVDTIAVASDLAVSLVDATGLVGTVFFDDPSCDACVISSVVIVQEGVNAGAPSTSIVAAISEIDLVAVWPFFCTEGFGFDPEESCTECRNDYYGSSCSPCLACENSGECKDGVAGDGECTCASAGFDVTTRCEDCLFGFFASNGNCLSCQCEDGVGCDEEGECLEEEANSLFGAGIAVDILIFVVITVVIAVVVGKTMENKDTELQERRASRLSNAAQDKSTTPALEAAKAEYAATDAPAAEAPAAEAKPEGDGEKA